MNEFPVVVKLAYSFILGAFSVFLTFNLLFVLLGSDKRPIDIDAPPVEKEKP
jgi:hypothetical protein